jgi:hypothetical protein
MTTGNRPDDPGKDTPARVTGTTGVTPVTRPH